MIKNAKGGGKVRKYAVLTIFTFIFVLLACNAAAAADTSSNNPSTLQTHEQIQNNSQLTNNQSYTTSNSQKTSKNTTQLKNITITGKVERCNSGGPFSGVTITVKNNGTTLASTTTKKDGTYTVNFQSIYTLFQVTASSTGHNPSTKNITVSNNGSYYGTANFKLGADNIYIDDNWANYRNGRSVQFYDGTTHTIGSDAFDTISEAVSNVNAGGTIYIANGTYTVQGVSINKNLNIIGQSRDGVILTGGNSNRIFAISSGRTVTISNITFTNGLASNSNGGAIQNNGGTLTLNNCAFTSNKATRTGYWDNNDVYGGAIYNTGTLTIRNSNFTSNTVTSGSNNYAYGGAIYNSGTLTITGSNFTSNTATTYGGAIINYGTLTITGSNFTSNTAYDGGAISNGDTGTSPTGSLTITGSNFTSNTATSAGGAIWTHGTCNVTGSNFTSNTANDSGGDTAKGSGGAIRNWGTLTVTGSNFTWNSATTNGGAISNYQGTANINFNRIIGNGANDINAEYNGGTSTVNAENNWWGSNTGASAGRVTAANGASADANPWIILKINASPTSILVGGTSAVTADLTWNSNNIQPTGGHVPDGTVSFSGTLGSVNPTSGVMVNGLTTTTFTAGNTSGTATVSATLDGVTVSTPITLRPVANLGITQTVNSPVNVGSTVTYTVTVKNNGPNTAHNIRIQDLIPAGFTVDTHGVGSYSSGIWTIPSLANGESVILTITGTATASMAGLTTSNTATELDQTEEHTSPLPTSTAGVYTKKADVKLTQTTSSTPVNVGDTVTYTVTATNRGPDTATNINIRDIIPSGLTNVVITPSAGTTYSNGIWTIPNLINGGIATLTIAGKAGADMAGLTTTNTATRISQTEYNSESATSTSSGIYVKKANVVITNTANSSKLNVGQTGTFTVTVTNNGPDTATNIIINDPLPNGFSASVTGGTYSNGVWTINSLASQQSLTLTFTGLITSTMAGTNIVNHATETQTEYPPATITDATIHVNKANVVVTITPSNNRPNVGQSYTYTVTVKNNGDDDATDVTVSGAVPDGLTLNNYHISMGSFTSNGWYIGTLASGNTAILTVTVTPQSSAAGQDITAAVTETQNEYPQTNSATSTVHVPKANVAISKTVNDVSKAIVNVGNTITYLITVTNNGPDSATGLQITDLVPSGLSNLVYSASTGTYSLATGLWNIGTLLNSETATLTITGKITAAMAGLNVTNYANVTAQNEYSSLPVVSAADVYTKLAEVKLSQTATPKANVGDTVTYKVYVTNNGPDAATNMVLSDMPPSSLSNVHVTASIGTYSDGIWTISSLGSGETAILTITGTATSSMAGKLVNNTATLTAQTEYDPSTIGDSTTAGVYTNEANVGLSQNGSYSGNKVTFVVKAANNGPNTATNINIKDLIPAGLTGVSVTVNGGTYDQATGIWTISSLDNGEFATLTITGTATPQTTVKNNVTWLNQTEYNSNVSQNVIKLIYVPSADVRVNIYTTTGKYDNWDVNNDVTWAMDLINNGPDDAHNIIASVVIPAGLEFMGADARSNGYWTYNTTTRTLTWYIAFMPSGGAASLDLLTYISKSGNIIMTATKTNQTETDPTTSNNVRSRTLTIPKEIDIKVTQTTNNLTPTIGQTITYTITVTNNGPDNATGLTIKDSLPSGLTFQSADTQGIGTYDSNTGIWTIGNLNNGQTATLTITATVNNANMIKNTAKLETKDQYDWNFNNNAQTTIINQGSYVPSADVRVNIYTTTGKYDNWDVNNDVTWAMDLINNGPDDAHNIIASVVIPAGLEFMGADARSNGYWTYNTTTRTLTWYIAFMPSGGAASLDLLTYISKSGNIIMTATKTNQTETDPTTSNNVRSRTLTIPKEVDIQVTQTVNGESTAQVTTGSTVTFTIVITNNGDNATGLTITDLLPTSLTFQSADTQGIGTYDSNTGIWTIGNLNNGQTATLTITATVNNGTADTTLINSVTLQNKDQYDWNFNNNAQKTYLSVTD